MEDIYIYTPKFGGWESQLPYNLMDFFGYLKFQTNPNNCMRIYNQPCGYNGDMLVYIAVTNKMMVCFVERQGICPVSDFIKNGPVAGKLSQNYCNKSWSLQSIHFESPIIFTKIAWTIKLCGYPVLKPTPKLSLGLKILLIINGCRINETGKMGFIRKLRGCWEFATHDFAFFYQKHWGDQSTTKSRYKLNFAAMTEWNLTTLDYAHAISSGNLLMRCSISEILKLGMGQNPGT